MPIKPWVISDGVDGLLDKIREHAAEAQLGINVEENSRRALSLFNLLDNHIRSGGRLPTWWD